MNYLVFDVESVGLHGEGFAVGYVVVNDEGVCCEEGLLACSPDVCDGDLDSRQWIAEHIPPLPTAYASAKEVRDAFWDTWVEWREKGAVLVADCAWPVEARFLCRCVDDDYKAREWGGPYPLHDLASVLVAKGRDPLAITKRQPDELPAHNPLCDARQSARQLLEALR